MMQISQIVKKHHLTDGNDNTVLHLALKDEGFTQKEIVEILKILLDRGFNPNLKNENKETVLQLAINRRMEDVIDLLLTCITNSLVTLHFFIEDECEKLRKLALRVYINGIGDPPDHETITLSPSMGYYSKVPHSKLTETENFVEWLLSRGFDFDCKNENNQSALLMAIEHNLQHILPILLKNTKDIGFVDGENKTLLHLFLEGKNKSWHPTRYAVNIVDILLDRGVSAFAEDNTKCTPIQMALENEKIELFEILLKRSINATNINQKNSEGETFFCTLIRKWRDSDRLIDVARVLIAKGADINEPADDGKTPLSHAIKKRSLRMIMLLHENGANFSVIKEDCEILMHRLLKIRCGYGYCSCCHRTDDAIDDEAKMRLFERLLELTTNDNNQNSAIDAFFYEVIAKWLNSREDKAYCYEKVARALLAKGADVNRLSEQGWTPLCYAVQCSNLRVVEFLQQNGANFSVTTKNGENLMQLFFTSYHYMRSRDETIFHLLLQFSTNIHHKDFEGRTVFYTLISNWEYLEDGRNDYYIKVAHTLIAKGADVNEPDKCGRRPVHRAVERGNLAAVELLRENGADFSATTNDGGNLVHLFVNRYRYLIPIDERQMALFELLLELSINVHQKNSEGDTAFYLLTRKWAASRQEHFDSYTKMARALIAKGADVNEVDKHGKTSLSYAVANQNLPLIEFLGENGADFSVTTEDGETLIHLLVRTYDYFKTWLKTAGIGAKMKLFELLFSKGCQINAKDKNGATPLHVAVKDGKYEMVETLLELGADVNSRNNRMETPVAHATESCCLRIMMLLQKNGAEFPVTMDKVETLMGLLLDSCYHDAVEEDIRFFGQLLVYSKNINKKNAAGYTFFHRVIKRWARKEKTCYCLNVARALLDKGADINEPDNRGMTPVCYAVEVDNLHLVEFLRENGADFSVTTKNGNTLLHLFFNISQSGDNVVRMPLFELLLNQKRNLYRINSEGETVFHVMIKKWIRSCEEDFDSYTEIARTLIAKGANINLPDKNGKTALGLAIEERNLRIVEFLRDNGADFSVTTKNGNTLLHLFFNISQSGDNVVRMPLFELLLNQEKNLNRINSEGETVFHVMIKKWIRSCEEDFDSYTEIARTLISKGANVNLPDKNGKTALDFAVERRNLRVVEFLRSHGADFSVSTRIYETMEHEIIKCNLEIYVRVDIELFDLLHELLKNVHHKNSKGETLFHALIRKWASFDYKFNDHLRNSITTIARILIGKGANVNEKNNYGKTLLDHAIEKHNLPIAKFLSENGADFSTRTDDGETLMHLLVKKKGGVDGKVEMKLFKLLISKGCLLNAKDNYGTTPLHVAAKLGKVDIARKLLEHGFDVNCKNHRMETPLYNAIGKRHINMVELLQENGADFSIRTEDGETMMFVFVKTIDCQTISDDDAEKRLFELIITKGCQVNASDRAGTTPLEVAVMDGNITIVRRLLEYGADVNCRTSQMETPLIRAIGKHNLNMIKIVEENGADFSTRTENGTLMHLLVKSKYCRDQTKMNLFELLKGKGCQVDARDNSGATPLHLAVEDGQMAIVRKLLEHGADVNCRNNKKETPLVQAIRKHGLEMVNLLERNGANFSVTTEDGRSLLHLLVKGKNCWKDDDEAMKLLNMLISKGCQVNARDITGTTPLHVAAMYSNAHVVRELIEYGARVNCKNNAMETPLHFATRNPKVDAVAGLLLEHGANVNAKNMNGHTPLHKIAIEPRSEHSYDGLKRLLQYGADINLLDSQNRTALSCARSWDLNDWQQECQDCLIQDMAISDVVISLTKHSIRLKAVDLPWDREIYGCLGDFYKGCSTKDVCEEYYEKCLQEIQKLKSTFIENPTSLYDFLHLNLNDKRVYVKHEMLQNLIRSPDKLEMFPIYADLILASYREALARKALLEPAKKAWLRLTAVKLPAVCLDLIFSDLSNSDLIDMIQRE